MRLIGSPNNIRNLFPFALVATLILISAAEPRAQEVPKTDYANRVEVSVASSRKTTDPAPALKPETTDARISALEQLLLEQSQRLDRLQQTISEKQQTIPLLAARLNAGDDAPVVSGATAGNSSAAVAPQTTQTPTEIGRA